MISTGVPSGEFAVGQSPAVVKTGRSRCLPGVCVDFVGFTMPWVNRAIKRLRLHFFRASEPVISCPGRIEARKYEGGKIDVFDCRRYTGWTFIQFIPHPPYWLAVVACGAVTARNTTRNRRTYPSYSVSRFAGAPQEPGRRNCAMVDGDPRGLPGVSKLTSWVPVRWDSVLFLLGHTANGRHNGRQGSGSPNSVAVTGPQISSDYIHTPWPYRMRLYIWRRWNKSGMASSPDLPFPRCRIRVCK